MKKFKRLFLTALCVAASLIPLPPAGISAAGNALDVKWNYGYVGSMGNALGNENKLGSLENTGTSYRFTDVVLIKKAGTTVWFTEKGSGNSGFCSRTGYSISSWKVQGDDYVLDTEWANYPGTDGISAGIASRSGDSVTYMYTTGKDNEYLRFCFCITGDTDSKGNVIFPTIYSAFTDNPGTFTDECDADSAPVIWGEDGVVGGFEWFDGYVGSDKNDEFYVEEIRPYFTDYSYTGIITVPLAGTTISFTDTSSPFVEADVYAVSSWKPAGITWALDSGGANFSGINTGVYKTDGEARVYSYTTTKDNESIRLCVRTGGVDSAIPTVYWSASESSKDTASPVNDEETPPPSDTKASDGENTDALGDGSDGIGGGLSAGSDDTLGITLMLFTGAAYLLAPIADNIAGRTSRSGKKQKS